MSEITKKVIEEHGLSTEEYERILKILGREPNVTELGVFSVMWSEHCSYKSSRVHLKNFPTKGPHVLQGPGENAGIIAIGDGKAVAFKMESHNHPSYIEPYQGAATGVGGILRDIFTMGARPIACMDSLHFGSAAHPKTPYLLRGVVSGIGGYGNTMGIPTIGGELSFDESYNGNILVNVFSLGIMDSNKIYRGKAKGEGNPVIYVGSKTGRDGIHGATMASDVFGEGGEERRPTVQVGDPFMEKLLMEACLELMATDAIEGIQDMGAAGLTCSSFEMADRAGSGMDIDLDLVPKRAFGMTAYEIMLSESQERMLIVAKKGREDDVLRIFEKWDLNAAVIGEVTDTKRVRGYHDGRIVLDLPVSPVVKDAPVYERKVTRPKYLDKVKKCDLSEINEPKNLNDILTKLISSPNLACKAWVWEQYDHMVMTNTFTLPGSDAACIRIKGTNKGIAISTDCQSRHSYLDPYIGATYAVAEAARNISCSGAVPMGVTDCLNFGNPERPEIMWQFKETVAGIADACRKFGTPVTGGNVSFYNETSGEAVYPTPVIGMVGLIEDVNFHCTQFWKSEGDAILLLGAGKADICGSEYLKTIHGKVCGALSPLNYEMEIAVQNAVRTGIERGLVRSAHDVSDGGLATALAECSMTAAGKIIGAVVNMENGMRPDVFLFGEAPSLILVSVSKASAQRMLAVAGGFGVHSRLIGETGGEKLKINNLIDVELAKLRQLWMDAIPKIAGEKVIYVRNSRNLQS